LTLSYWIKNNARIWLWFVSNYSRISTIIYWESKKYHGPTPDFVKQTVILNYHAEAWIETGTYMGETTKLLAKHSRHVTTIEADKNLYDRGKEKLRSHNIEVLFGNSAELIENAIIKYLKAGFCNLNFFLDGHYSGPGTSNLYGETPILQELEIIKRYLKKFKSCHILIDDFSAFKNIILINNEITPNYPSRNFLVDFATTEELSWSIEQDIFILSKSS
jgi:hypothetical protein